MRRMEKLRIVVGGYIGLYPTGGATWDYIQYPLGLKLLGHDVYYIEDTGQYPIFQKEEEAWDDAFSCVEYLRSSMERCGMKDKWAYRDVASGKCFGMTEEKIIEICNSADLFINISYSTYPRDEYMKIPNRFLIDSDPMFTQMQYVLQENSGSGKSQMWTTRQMVENHSHLFSFGENIGSKDCRIPSLNLKWIPTRQPIVLNLWKNDSTANSFGFTSIMNWSGRKKLLFEDQEWGQKDVEFNKFKQIPGCVKDINFEVVINRPLNKESQFDLNEYESLGWKVLDPEATVGNASDYRNFIFNSTAEFGVAKETYVKSNSGWFSCRSACYLAAGRPVISQETTWSKYIPSGDGLFAFHDLASAADAIEAVKSNQMYHSKRALEVAIAYFDSSIVLTKMLEHLN
jgi:hypothetical protein